MPSASVTRSTGTNPEVVWIWSKRSRAADTLPAERFRLAIFLMDMVV